MSTEAQIKKDILVFGALFFISILFFVGDTRGIISGVKGFFGSPFLFLEKPFFSLSRSTISFYDFVVAWPQREEKYNLLRDQLLQATVDQSQLSVCLTENEYIKKLLGASLPTKWKFTEARVIGTGDNLRLDLGKNDGIAEGMNVISENILVGRIAKVNESDSLVDLPEKADFKIPVLVKSIINKQNQGLTMAKGVLTGKGQNRLQIDRVLQEEKLTKDDYILTTGEDGWLPNLLIGRIDQIENNKTAIYQKASVLPLLDYRKLEMVFIVIKN